MGQSHFVWEEGWGHKATRHTKKKKPKKTCQRPLGEREEEKRANRHKAAGD